MKTRLLLFLTAAALLPSPASAQTVEERARAAAAASRAKTSDSDAIQQNYLTPGLAGQPITTVDNSTAFNTNIACQKTATLLELLAQPAGTGDIGTLTISRDKDLDGTIDQTLTLPVAVSGICANGVISCQAGTWDQCRNYQWAVGSDGNLKLTEVDMTALAGCYCINNSCGSNLVWGNMASVLKDLGGGVIGALTTSDPRIGVAQAVIDGPTIRYTGAQSTACSASPDVAQTTYRANPTAIATDAYAASTSNSIFQALAASPVGVGTTQQVRHCQIERRVTVTKPGIDDVISKITGAYSTIKTNTSLDWLIGSPSDNTLNASGSCQIFEFRTVLEIKDPTRLIEARLYNIFFDDWLQVRIDGRLVLADPGSWTSDSYPPGTCERKQTWYNSANIDLIPYLTEGEHEIVLRVAVGGGGEVFGQIHVAVDDSCQTLEQLVDQCGTFAADPQCQIDSELVDGVQTLLNGIATGLHPLAQTRVMGSTACPVELTRDFFLKDRTYRCTVDSVTQPDTSRGAYIIDRSTETLLADRTMNSDGSYSTSTRSFTLPDRGSVPACEAICKTRAPKVNTGVAVDGVVGEKQNDASGYDTFYHSCSADNVCPTGDGEEVVTACGCLDDFPEAVVMMQTVRLAGADLVCTGTVR